MICHRCRIGNCNECLNLVNPAGEERNPPTKTWCDCHHKVGVYINAPDCNHLRVENHDDPEIQCPSCGKVDPFDLVPRGSELEQTNSSEDDHS